MPRGLTSAQIENILYDDNVTELGDSDLSEEDDIDDSDYIPSDRESDENESESAPAHSSRKRKRDDGESGLVVGASSLSTSQPLHDLASQADTPSTSQAQRQTINADADVQWEWRDGNDFLPTDFQFDLPGRGIPHGLVHDGSTESEYFRLFFTEDIMALIVKESNKFYGFMIAGKILHPHSRFLQWHDTDINEMYSFLALVMLMGLTPRQNYKEYWSTDPLLRQPIFSKVMSVNRFIALLQALHFQDNTQPTDDDKMRKIRPIFDYICHSFRSSFKPFQNLVIDESLVLWRGNLHFRQYIPSKRHRFGLKIFVLCDCETGFILDMILYTGARTNIKENKKLGISGSVVSTMLESYLGQGHTLFVDNWYTSPTLFHYLHERMTGACGTVKPNRKFMAKFPIGLQKGDVVHKQANNILAVKWKDKRDVHLLTSVHEPKLQRSENIDHSTNTFIDKPEAVIVYNQNMRLVDKSDSMMSSVECSRKTMKWYKKMFFHLIDCAVLNAHILYQVKTGEKPTLHDFTREVIRQLLEQYSEPLPTAGRRRAPHGDDPTRLTGRHFPKHIPPTAAKKNAQKPCHVCRTSTLRPKQRKDTRFMCVPCDTALCLDPCFEVYHTLKIY